MIKFLSFFFILLVVALYFWYVQGFDIGPILQKAKGIHIRVTLDDAPAVPDGDPVLGGWEIKKKMLTARTEVAAVALDGKVYVIGGIDGFGRSVNMVEIYNPKTDEWVAGPPLPEKRHHVAAVSVGEKLFVIGGHAGLNFAPTKKMWMLEGDGWRELANLPEARGAAAVASYVNSEGREQIYIFGGAGENGVSNRVFTYDVGTNEWTRIKDMPTEREHFGAATIGDKIYVVGGRENSVTKNRDDLEVYFPEKNIWAIGPPMPSKRGGIAVASVRDRLYVFGGEHPVGTYDTVEEYHPETKTWRTMNPMPTRRHGLGVAVMDGSVYVIGGGKRPFISVSKANEKFTPFAE